MRKKGSLLLLCLLLLVIFSGCVLEGKQKEKEIPGIHKKGDTTVYFVSLPDGVDVTDVFTYEGDQGVLWTDSITLDGKIYPGGMYGWHQVKGGGAVISSGSRFAYIPSYRDQYDVGGWVYLFKFDCSTMSLAEAKAYIPCLN